MKIRVLHERDIHEVAKLEQTVWKSEGATAEQIQSRQDIFSQGSIVAELPDGRIIGYAVTQLVEQISTGSWASQTDDGMISRTHKEDGTIVYGVNMSVLPEGAGYNVSGAVIDFVYDQFITNGFCNIICLGSRLPGFARWQDKHDRSIHDYLSRHHKGMSIDPELRLYEKNGFKLLWSIPDYFPDPVSLNFGAMIGRSR